MPGYILKVSQSFCNAKLRQNLWAGYYTYFNIHGQQRGVLHLYSGNEF